MGGGAGANTGAGGLVVNSPTSFAQALLASLGISATPTNLQAVTAWEQAEGGNWSNTAAYNPLNTSLQLPGSVNYQTGQPGPGVQKYTSWAQGVQATQETLENSNPAYGYGQILASLQSSSGVHALSQAVGASKWGTGYFAGGQTAQTTAATTTGGGTTAGATSTFGGLSGSAPPAPAQSANPITDLGRDVTWFGQFAAWTLFTALIFLFGLILLLIGAVMLGVVLFGPVIGPAGSLIPGPVGRLARSGKGSAVGSPARTVAAVRGPRARTSRSTNSTQVFAQRRSLQEQRHEHRMTEIEHRASARRSTQGRPTSSTFDEPFPD